LPKGDCIVHSHSGHLKLAVSFLLILFTSQDVKKALYDKDVMVWALSFTVHPSPQASPVIALTYFDASSTDLNGP
jgi:hypothetical protein